MRTRRRILDRNPRDTVGRGGLPSSRHPGRRPWTTTCRRTWWLPSPASASLRSSSA